MHWLTFYFIIQMNPKVDFYFTKSKKWSAELQLLRPLPLACGLTEELKWGSPCYTHEGRNIVLIHEFKEYFALLFFKGALLKDPEGVLVQQSQQVQAARQMRFSHKDEIKEWSTVIKAYIKEAIAVEKAGLKVTLKPTEAYAIPEEFQEKLNSLPKLKKAFESLTPGRQRGYLLFFAAAKQSKTREARIEKCIPRIMEGKGLND